MNRCNATFQVRCELPSGHDGLHRNGEHTWVFTDTRPEWRRRADAAWAARGWVAAKATDPA